jgi:chaperonin GroEL (HSP60 family)
MLANGMAAPLRRIVRNCRQDPDQICAELLALGDSDYGFDQVSGTVAKMSDAGALDAVSTVRGALDHAVASVGRYLAELY